MYILIIDYANAANERRSVTADDVNDIEVKLLTELRYTANKLWNINSTSKEELINFMKTKDLGDGTPNVLYLVEQRDEDRIVHIDLLGLGTRYISRKHLIKFNGSDLDRLERAAINAYYDKFGEYLDESKEVYKNSNTTITEALRSLR